MVSAVLALLAGLVIVFLITVVTGYFVAQEFAYMAVDRSRLAARSEAGDDSARRALQVTRQTSFMLSGAQLGITITGLLVGYVAEPLIGQSVGTLLGGSPIPLGVSVAIGTIFALLLSTVVQMLFGELFPKNLAIARADAVARRLARSTLFYLFFFKWLIWIFDKSSNLLLRVLKIAPVHDVEHSASASDLVQIAEDSRETGLLPAELSMLIDRIIDFPQRTVDHAMIPRSRVGTLTPDTTIAQARAVMTTGHSRYPIVADDQIIGVLHLQDVLFSELSPRRPVSELMRSALFVPELMSLPNALRELQRTKNQMACVIDEFGGFTGIITVEDLAEELVGEIADEHDPQQVDITSNPSQDSWTIQGDVHVDEAERTLGFDLPRGDYETIAGLLIASFGRLPRPDESVLIELPVDAAELVDSDEPEARYLRAIVLEIDQHVPSRVRVTIVDSPPADGGDEQ